MLEKGKKRSFRIKKETLSSYVAPLPCNLQNDENEDKNKIK